MVSGAKRDKAQRALASEATDKRVIALMEEYTTQELIERLKRQIEDIDQELRGDPRRRQPGLWDKLDEQKATLGALQSKQVEFEDRVRSMEVDKRIQAMYRKGLYAAAGFGISLIGALGFIVYEILKRLAELSS